MLKKIQLLGFALLSLFLMFLSETSKANDYPSNTGYWVESGDNTYYCEWSFFESTCKSGSTSSTPPVIKPVEGG